MTTLLDAIGNYLPLQTVGLPANQQLLLGKNLFLGRLPAEAPNAAVLIQQYQGESPTLTFGNDVSQLENPRIQIMTRGDREDYPGAYDLCMVVRNILGAITSTVTINGITILRLEPLGSPNPIGYDDVDRPRFTANLQAHILP